MANTKIEWADATWNPTTGCTKISPACDNCYAARMAHRLAANPTMEHRERYKDFRVSFWPERLTEPLKWRKPKRIFVVSMGDLFHQDVEFEQIAAIFGIMAMCEQHTFMLLTKRPARMKEFFQWLHDEYDGPCGVNAIFQVSIGDYLASGDGLFGDFDRKFEDMLDADFPLPNVWLGVTVEDQQRADERIPILLQCPAAVRFVSIEPMMGPIDLTNIGEYDGRPVSCLINHPCVDDEPGGIGIDWVIAGGETGPGARPSNPNWFRSLWGQCKAAGIPFFFKAWGDWAPEYLHDHQDVPYGEFHKEGNWVDDCLCLEGDETLYKIGKKAAGRMFDGTEYSEFPKRKEP